MTRRFGGPFTSFLTMTNQTRILWLIGIVVALIVLGQLLAILRWVLGVVILAAIIAVIVRAVTSDR